MQVSPQSGAAAPAVLMVFPWCLDWIGHGNIQRVLAMAAYLSRHGIAVDLIYQGNPRVPSREHELTGFRRVIRVSAWTSRDDARIASEWDAYYGSYERPSPHFQPGTAFTAAVRGLVDALDYSAVISSYAWTAPIFAGMSSSIRRIVDLHDILSQHSSRCQQATGKPSVFSLPEQTEQFLWRQWDAVLAITTDEAETIARALRPTQALLTVPHAVSVSDTGDRVEPASDTVVYTGSNNPSNEAAVKWLLGEVWPQVLAARPQSRLRLAGLICDSIQGTPLASTPGVELAGFVDHPIDELKRAAVCVAPYLYGSGLKIKVVEAAGSGRPIVTTRAGAEGTGLVHGTHLVVADDAALFAEAIVRLLDDRELQTQLASNARAHVQRAFSDDACYGRLLDLLQPVVRTEEPFSIPASAETRLLAAIKALEDPAVVVWGNGSHTRLLVATLRQLGAGIRCIVDKTPTGAVSPEHLPVVPASAFDAQHDDLVILSSQTYENEMWEDLAAHRARGTHVLALYQQQLVTDVLMCRILGKRTDWQGRSRLVIAEPNAGRSLGPFFRLARSLQHAAAGRVQVIVAGARTAADDVLEPADKALWEPAFEFAHWDALRETSGDIWRVVARYARILDSDLQRLTHRLALTGDDVVLFHMANVIDVIGVTNWYSSQPVSTLPETRLLFRFLPAQEAQWLNVTETELRNVYALSLALLDERAGTRVRILAQNDALGPELEQVLDRPVCTMGFPVSSTPESAGRNPTVLPKHVRVLYAGEARADKGFGVLPAIADALADDLTDGRLQLVCQSMCNEFADARIVDAARDLAARPGVDMIDRFLPSDEYDALLTSCDLILLPYDAEQYRARLSAVFVEATCAGLPVIVPAGTWMSDQLAQGLGAGVAFNARDAASIAEAVRRAVPSLSSLRRTAQTAAIRARRKHDPHAVLDTILASNARANAHTSIPA